MSGVADITTLGLAVDHHSVKQARDELGRFATAGDKAAASGSNMEQSWSKVKGVLAGLALGATIVQLIKQADTLTLLDARLRLATGSAGDFAKAQDAIYRISQKSNAGLVETTQLFTKLHEPVKRLGGGVKETSGIVEAFAASLRVGGASTQEAASATLQFAQAMGSGKLSGDEFRAIAEASPRFMKALADGMNVPIEKLKEMGSEGKLTADVVGNALMKSLSSLRQEMTSMPDTVGGAMTRMSNDFKVALNEINKSAGTTLGIAGIIDEARKLIPTLKQEMIGAFQSIGDWIERNKDGISQIWDQARLLAGEVWEVAKAAASIVGFVTESAVQSGFLRTVWETLRMLVAGFKDGVEIIGAAFAQLGSSIIQFLVAPLIQAGKLSAAIASVFDEDLANGVRANVKAIEEFAKSGERYADSVVTKFANGGSAVATLGASMEKAARDEEQLRAALASGAVSASDAAREMNRFSRQAEDAGGKLITLKSAHTELSKEQQQTLQRYNDLTQSIRANITELNLEAEGGVKLNEAQKATIKFKEELADKYKGFSTVQREAVLSLLNEWNTKIQLADATKKLAEATAEAAKAWEQQYAELERTNEQLREQVVQQAYANASVRTGIDFSAKLNNARLREKATAMELLAVKVEDKNLDFVRGQQYRDQAEMLRTLAQLNEENAAALSLKKIDDYLDPNKATTFGDALTKAFDGAGNALVKLTNTLSGYAAKQAELNKMQKALAENDTLTDEGRLKRQNALLKKQGELGVDTFASIAGSAKMFFNEGSKGYKTLEAAETAFRAYQLASDLVKGASAAAVGIAQQAQGDPYTAIPRMAAMAAIMAGLGFAVAGGFNKSAATIDVKKRQEETGTGTVLGDLTAKSESITNSIERMEDAATLANTYQSGMLTALKNIEASMTGVAQQILRANGLTTGKNLGIQEGTIATNKGDPLFGWTLLDKAIRSLPIIGGIVEKLQSLWGKTKQSIVDTGLNVSGRMGDLSVEQYADVQTTKSSWFGLVKKSSNSRVTEGVSDDIALQFDRIFTSIGETLIMSADQLGQDGEAVRAAIENFVIDISNLSLKDMDGDKIQEAIGAAVGAQADRMAQAILPGLEAFQNIGEGYYETLIRVAGATETAQVELEKLGITAIHYTDVINKQGDIGAEMVKQSIVQFETIEGGMSSVGKLISTFTGSASELADVYSELVQIRTALVDIGVSGNALTAALIKSAGGLDELAGSVSTYFDEFYTQEEQTAIGMQHLTEAFRQLGYDTVPKTREEFRALVGRIDETSEAGQTLLGKVLGLSGQFAKLVPSTKELAEAAEEAAQDVEDLAANLRKAFSDLVKTLKSELAQAFETFKNAIDSQKDALREAYDAQVDVIESAEKAARAQYDSVMARIEDERKVARAKYESEMAIIDAQRKAIATAQEAQQDAYKTAVKAVAAEKATATDAYRKASAAMSATMKTANETVSKLRGLNDMLRSTLDSMNPIGSDATLRQSAQADLRNMLAVVKSTGVLPDQKTLQKTLQILAKPSEDLFGSFEDYLRDFHYTKNDIADLADYTGTQLDSAQAQLDATVAMKEALDAANVENMARLDGIREALDLGNDLAKEAFESQLKGLDARAESARSSLDGTNASLDAQAEGASKVLDATLEMLAQAKETLTEKLELDLERLDALLQTAKDQYDKLVDIDNGIKDIPTALNDLTDAMNAYAAVTGKPTTTTTPPKKDEWVTTGSVQTFEDSKGAVAIKGTESDVGSAIIQGKQGQTTTIGAAADFVNTSLSTGKAADVAAAADAYGISSKNVDALAGLNEGTTAALTTGTASSKINGYTIQEIKDYINAMLAANNALAVYNKAKELKYTMATLDAVMGWGAGSAKAWAEANNLPAFAAGGMHSGGLRMVGEAGPELEATGPSRVWRLDQMMNAVRNSGRDSESADMMEMRKELAAMRQELKATTETIVINTNRAAKKLEAWDTDGIPEERVLS